MIDVCDLTELRDGVGEASLTGVWSVCERVTENLVLRCEKKEPIPAPHELTAGFTSAGGCGGVLEPSRLNGRIPPGRAAGGCGEASGEENTLVESRVDRILLASDFAMFTTLLDALLIGGAG